MGKKIVYDRYLGSTSMRYCPRCGELRTHGPEDCECGGLGEGLGKVATWTIEGYAVNFDE